MSEVPSVMQIAVRGHRSERNGWRPSQDLRVCPGDAADRLSALSACRSRRNASERTPNHSIETIAVDSSQVPTWVAKVHDPELLPD